jgi:hypothetical protein
MTILKHKDAYIKSFKDALLGNGLSVSYPSVDASSPYYIELNEEQDVSTFAYNVGKVIKDNLKVVKNIIIAAIYVVLALTIILRTFSGQHWLSDIIGGVLLPVGVYFIYLGVLDILKTKEDSYVFEYEGIDRRRGTCLKGEARWQLLAAHQGKGNSKTLFR